LYDSLVSKKKLERKNWLIGLPPRAGQSRPKKRKHTPTYGVAPENLCCGNFVPKTQFQRNLI